MKSFFAVFLVFFASTGSAAPAPKCTILISEEYAGLSEYRDALIGRGAARVLLPHYQRVAHLAQLHGWNFEFIPDLGARRMHDVRSKCGLLVESASPAELAAYFECSDRVSADFKKAYAPVHTAFEEHLKVNSAVSLKNQYFCADVGFRLGENAEWYDLQLSPVGPGCTAGDEGEEIPAAYMTVENRGLDPRDLEKAGLTAEKVESACASGLNPGEDREDSLGFCRSEIVNHFELERLFLAMVDKLGFCPMAQQPVER